MDRDLTSEAIAWIERLGRETEAFEVAGHEYEPDHRSDVVVNIQPSGLPSIGLLVETKTRLTPREAMAVAPVLRRPGESGIPVVCCPFISPRVAEILTRHHVGYVDQGGNARIAGERFFLHVTGRDNPAPDTRPLANPFSPKSSRIVRLMLEEPQRPWHVQELAREADVSIGLVSKAKQALMEEGYLWFLEGFLRLSDPDGLLQNWCRSYTNRDETASYYVMSSETEIIERLTSWCDRELVQWALSDFSGAWRLSPMVRHKLTSIVVLKTGAGEQRHTLLEHLGAKPVDSGANLSLRFTGDEYTFYKSRIVDQVRVLSPLQLYLDLKTKTGRGDEAAEALYDQHLRERFAACRNEHAHRRTEHER
jgi:hypothetical protein